MRRPMPRANLLALASRDVGRKSQRTIPSRSEEGLSLCSEFDPLNSAFGGAIITD